PLRSFYVTLYERYFTALAAPLVVADCLLRGMDAKARLTSKLHAKPSVVLRLERARGYDTGLVTKGVHRHMRNSFSHALYEVLSRDAIRMEDRDPNTGKLTWGPETF